MKKYLFLVLLVLVFSVVAIAGKPNFQAANVKNPVTGEAKNTVTIPSTAVEVAPNIYYLGQSIDNGRFVEGYAFITPKKGYGKPGTECGNGVCEPSENKNNCPSDCGDGDGGGGNGGGDDTSSCYEFLGKEAKWRTIEPYIVNPTNTEGLDETFVSDNLASDIDKWETAASTNILGNEVNGTVDGADTENPDDKNEVMFGDVSDSGAIAVTIVWGIFRGKPSERELVEWDQVYDQVDYDWSSSGESGKMDFENIATHELGHSVGLADLYEDKCSEQTMYGYADYGETKKRTLETGDKTGIQELYK